MYYSYTYLLHTSFLRFCAYLTAATISLKGIIAYETTSTSTNIVIIVISAWSSVVLLN